MRRNRKFRILISLLEYTKKTDSGERTARYQKCDGCDSDVARREDGSPYKARLTSSGRAYNLCLACYGLSFTDPAKFVENLQREDAINGCPDQKYSDELAMAEMFYEINPEGVMH